MLSVSSCNKGNLSAARIRIILLLAISFILICMTACGAFPDAGKSTVQESGTETEAAVVMPDMTELRDEGDETKDDNMKKLRMEINGTEVAVSWEDNESVAALTELAEKTPITIQMSMYGGFEQVGPLGTSFPRNDQQTTTSAGDIVLYSGNQIVVFYGSNSWSYTRLGHIEMFTAEIADLLSHEDATVRLFVE